MCPNSPTSRPRLTQGYQFNSLFDYSTGTPLSVLIGKDYSFTDEAHDRASIVPGVARYLGQTIPTTSSGARNYTYLNKCGVRLPGRGSEKPDGLWRVWERTTRWRRLRAEVSGITTSPSSSTRRSRREVNSEFRVEIFNLFNQHNFASPSVSNFASGTFGEITNTKNGSGSPGIGYGEPFNIQFALKLMF